MIGLSKGKRSLVEKFRKESEPLNVDSSEVPGGSITTTQSTQDSASIPVPQRVMDFNARIANLQRSREPLASSPGLSDRQDDQDNESEEDNEEEAPIPSLQSPAKPAPSIADRFSVTPRAPRIPLEMATIAIDGETTTSPIGSPAKRPKPLQSSGIRPTTRIPGRNSRVTSFGNKLSQQFSAPGTAPEPTADEVDDEDDEPNSNDHSRENSLNDDGMEDVQEAQNDNRRASGYKDGRHGDSEVEGAEDQNLTKKSSKLDDDYIDEEGQRQQEAARVETVIKAAEDSVHVQDQENIQRANAMLKGSRKKDSTIDLIRNVNITASALEAQLQFLHNSLASYEVSGSHDETEDEGVNSAHAEEKLSLTISKSDFAKMRIVGQFNLGFILATRTSSPQSSAETSSDLFIIDQHASDEKYNFERLSSTTILQSQPLVTPKTLDLTALEEELVLEHQSTLSANGFITSFDDTGVSPVGQRVKLLALPLSQSTTFNLSDFEELLSLLSESSASSSINGTVVRPSKVRKMFAMRACRSSIMIGKTLTSGQMGRLVRKLGELDKPWNCPHGRPTMRHLCGLGVWDDEGWTGDADRGERVDWSGYVKKMQAVTMDGLGEEAAVTEEEEDDEQGGHAADEYYAMHENEYAEDDVYEHGTESE